MYMSNKTIYVSEQDESLFEDAKTLAGEALSSVIARALREFVARHTQKQKGMKEIGVKIGAEKTAREQRFVGQELGKWSGLSNDKEWWMESKIYRTQKGNWAIYLVTVCKASLLTNPDAWRYSKEYLVDVKRSELLVEDDVTKLKKQVPSSLFTVISDLAKKDEQPIEYLDI